jgi:hypothetical protein
MRKSFLLLEIIPACFSSQLFADRLVTQYWIVSKHDFPAFLASADKPMVERMKVLSKIALTKGAFFDDAGADFSMEAGGLDILVQYSRLKPPENKVKEIIYEMRATALDSSRVIWCSLGRAPSSGLNKFTYREDWDKPDRKKRESFSTSDDDGEHVVVFLDLDAAS